MFQHVFDINTLNKGYVIQVSIARHSDMERKPETSGKRVGGETVCFAEMLKT